MKTLKEAVYGAAIGDAVGVPFEFKLRGSFECTDMIGMGTHRQPCGTWSDDTAMMLGICDSIRLSRGRIDVSDIQNRFCDWAFHGKYTCDGRVFDIGQTVALALKSRLARSDEFSNGNGSLMRTIPLAFVDCSDDEIRKVSAITHAHAVSMEACVYYVHIARALNAGRDLNEAVTENIPQLPAFSRLSGIISLPENEISSTGYVIHTLEAALWCLGNTSNYRDCIIKAVNLGNDTDTTACVAGGLAGILYGIEGIPSDWITKLRAKNLLDSWLFE